MGGATQILSAYFVVLPLRDEGDISLGLDTLPGLFAGSVLASLAFSLLRSQIPGYVLCPHSLSLSSSIGCLSLGIIKFTLSRTSLLRH